MFNRAGYNQIEFNTTSNTDVNLYVTLSAEAGMESGFNALFNLTFAASGDSSVKTSMLRQIVVFGNLSADGTITSNEMRVIALSRRLSALSGIEAALVQLRVEEIEFMGDFSPGDVIVIDMQNLTCTVNGTNVLHLINLDQFNLRPGNNELTFQDEAGTRTLQIMVTHRDRWL